MLDIHYILKLIKDVRKEKGYSQEQMGEILGINQANYGKLEAGKTEMKVTQLAKLLDFLEIDMFKEREEPKKEETTLIALNPETMATSLSSIQNQLKQIEDKRNEELSNLKAQLDRIEAKLNPQNKEGGEEPPTPKDD